MPRDAKPVTGATDRTDAPKVLIVDDDPDVVEILADTLRGRGYLVMGARDGVDVMEDREVAGFGRLSNVDVLITDLRMPRAGGFELMRYIRANGWPVAIVVVSAFGDQNLRAWATELGATAVLHKPFYLDDLVRLVQRLAPIGAGLPKN